MERILLLVVMPALLHAGFNSTAPNNVSLIPTSTTKPTTVIKSTAQPIIIQLPPVLARVKVDWDKTDPCHGRMMLSVNFTTAKPLCIQKANLKTTLGNELCEERRCGKFQEFDNSRYPRSVDGYSIAENRSVITASCRTVFIICKDNNELLAYKVITGLLLTLVLAVILFRFAWPMYIAVRKRFSQKQENRWIGPTQSQSVSYHRGQAGHLKNDTGKRHSYPGLERLSVNPSREPSSNRNSDYDSYGYN
ncbi:hypothetical protein NFI96_013209 [Prochilodus magdalenae]|nr:hypothetical protein NFI96_013209 [Prochilodus magdalenae]